MSREEWSMGPGGAVDTSGMAERVGAATLLEDIGKLSAVVCDMKVELSRLQRERDTMAGKVQELARAIASSEHRVYELMQLNDRFRKERDVAVEEIGSLSEQYSSALEMIERLRGKIEDHAQVLHE
ncbi:MAG: hypothetical protein JXR96_16000 [Deltaproteobacteria bacterium]|nr:hypothetical protein [Deltaproteobacteria bacterium]